MPIQQPDPQPLSLPDLAVTFCSSYTGDCIWVRKSPTPQEPGQAPKIQMGDAADSFPRHDVAGHELHFFSAAYTRAVFLHGGLDAVVAMIESSHEDFNEEVYEIIQRDLRNRLAELAKQ